MFYSDISRITITIIMKHSRLILIAVAIVLSVGLWSCGKDDTNRRNTTVIPKPTGLGTMPFRMVVASTTCGAL